MDIIKGAAISNTAEFSRASAGSYRNRLGVLASAAVDVPRFHYDEGTEACRLLVEAAATNLLLRSQEFENAVWVASSGASVTANTTAAPDGTTTADTLTTTDGTSRLRQAVTLTDGAAYTFSVWAKSLTGDTTMTVDAGDGAGVSKTVTAAISRLSFTLVAGTSDWLDIVMGGAATVALWGAQLEAGSVATSYIATTSATVTRAADIIPAGCKFVCALPENDYAAWAGGTVYSKGDRVISTTAHKIYESLRGNKGTVTITNASPGVVSFPSHGFPANRRGRFSTTGTLPSPLVAGTDYYVTAANLLPDSFTVSATAGGAVINTTTAGSGVHTFTEVVNLGFDPTVAANTVKGSESKVTDATMWLEVGSTNKWRAFDMRSSDQMTAADAIEFAFLPGQITALGLANISADSGSVTLYDLGGEGLVFSEAGSLVGENVFDWLQYFIADIIRKTDTIYDGIPLYARGLVTVSLKALGGTAALGECVAGKLENIGRAQWGAKPGMTNFGRMDTDRFGNRDLEPGNYQKRLSIDVFVEDDFVDEAHRKLISYRNIPLLYVGSQTKTSTILYGYYNDYDVVLQSIAGSFISADIEGL